MARMTVGSLPLRNGDESIDPAQVAFVLPSRAEAISVLVVGTVNIGAAVVPRWWPTVALTAKRFPPLYRSPLLGLPRPVRGTGGS